MITTNTKIKVIIVEDEALLAQDIAFRLEDCNCEVLGIAASAAEALRLLKEHSRVDILLIDIFLQGDTDGIALAEIVNRDFKIPFIFLSAHADKETVARAKKVRPNAYLLKPFNDLQVQVAIEMALVDFSNQHSVQPSKQRAVTAPKREVLHIKDSLFLKKDQHFERVPLKEILFLEADNNYCTVHTPKDQFLYSWVLKKMEQQLPTNQFIRIHRSYVVNINAVTGFEGNLLYVGNQKLPVSKAHKDEVFRLFKTI